MHAKPEQTLLKYRRVEKDGALMADKESSGAICKAMSSLTEGSLEVLFGSLYLFWYGLSTFLNMLGVMS